MLKRAMKLFRFSRAPFNSGRFGQQIQEARQELLCAIRNGTAEELVEMWLGGVSRDRGVQPESFSKGNLIEILQKCAGFLVFLLYLDGSTEILFASLSFSWLAVVIF